VYNINYIYYIFFFVYTIYLRSVVYNVIRLKMIKHYDCYKEYTTRVQSTSYKNYYHKYSRASYMSGWQSENHSPKLLRVDRVSGRPSRALTHARR